MKQLILCVVLVAASLTNQLWAQTNFVATTPTVATPGSDNTLVGAGAGNLNMSGASNLFIGRGTGVQNMAGTQNAFMGASAGNQNTSGQNNSFVGYSSGYSNTTGNNNTFLGSGAGYTNASGYNNVFSGYRAGYFNTQGNNNAFFGTGAGYSNVLGNDNTFMGADAGSSNTSGKQNVFVGSLSGAANTGGFSNTSIGTQSGSNLTTGRSNSFIGNKAGFSNQTGTDNVIVGDSAGYSSTVRENVMIGAKAGYNNVNGINNLFIGNRSGYGSTGSTAYGNVCVGPFTGTKLTSGFFNLIVGPYSGGNVTTGSNNTFIGYASGGNNIVGKYNTLVGDAAGYSLNANYNVLIGAQAGFNTTSGENNVMIGLNSGTNNQTGSSNTFIGISSGSTQGQSNLQNATAIGANAQVAISDAIVLGNNAVKVGISTSSPQNKLEINQGTVGNSGLRFTTLTKTFVPTATTNKFLTVDANGDVILANYGTPNFRVAATDSGSTSNGLWKVNGDNLQNTNTGGVVIGSGVEKTPAGYRLYVAEGILTEKVKVAVKSTGDWSDRVFENGYHLRGLNEVEQYVALNKHLPGVPSAQEVVSEGVDVGRMQAKLLEKVEELTLYVIDLKKQNDALAKKSRNLERRINKLQPKTRK